MRYFMPRRKHWSDFQALEQKQLDAKLNQSSSVRSVEVPQHGWIKSARQALGMTAAQLGSRLRMSPQAVLTMEKREVAGTITLGSLQKAARALNCEARVVFVSNEGIAETVQQRAMKKAREERNRIVHTMGLEAQAGGVSEALDLEKIAESWKTVRRSRLWDDVSDAGEK
jgi:predicted DNA-binding mobile mystery protein A